ncbi:unnamed protein product [Meloidogyne enterolobii]|uniref:Uncharacterized protein n=1 Tax=Meloidogyne enterolobii TaxID=390850 RepID=A0ACB0ZH70_MELEN
MYPMKPYNEGIVVKPAKIVYEVSSYHINSTKNIENQMSKLEIKKDEIKPKESTKKVAKSPSKHQPLNSKDNEVIIKRLLELSKQLDIFIAKEGGDSKNKKQEEKCLTETSQNVSKKKEKKTETNKSSDVPCQNKPLNSSTNSQPTSPNIQTTLSIDGGSKFSFKEQPKNSPDIVHASVTPTTVRFPIHNYEDVDLQKCFIGSKINCILQEFDKPLVKLFKIIGLKRNVYFIEKGTNEESIEREGEAISIEISYGQKGKRMYILSDLSFLAKISGNGFDLVGELAIWKFIGSLLGLYSFNDASVSLKSDKWLLEASLLDNTRNNLDELSRRLNSYLGANDFLSSSHAICLADIVLRSRFSKDYKLIEWNQIAAANNVQIWAKHIDSALL